MSDLTPVRWSSHFIQPERGLESSSRSVSRVSCIALSSYATGSFVAASWRKRCRRTLRTPFSTLLSSSSMARRGGPDTYAPVLVNVPPWQGPMNLSLSSIQRPAQPRWGHTDESTLSAPLPAGTTYPPSCAVELRQPSVLCTSIVRATGPASEANSSTFPTSDQEVSSSFARSGNAAKRTSVIANAVLTRPPTTTNTLRRNDRRSGTESVSCPGTHAGVDIKLLLLLLGSKAEVDTFGVNFEWTIA